MLHVLGKAEIAGKEVEPDPASPWWAGKSHRSVQAGGFQEDGGRLLVATGEVSMPHIRNKAQSLTNPALWLQRLGEDTCSEQHLVQGGGKLRKHNKGTQDIK